MIEFKEKPANFIDSIEKSVPDYNELKSLVDKIFDKKDLAVGSALSYPCITISDYINVLFNILKEQVVVDSKINNDLFQAQTTLKVLFKDNNNLEKFLTMVLGSIIKICNEYKQNNNDPTKK